MTSIAVRALCFAFGSTALYIALFMYEGESGKWQSRIEELWVTISDRSILIKSRTAAFFNAVSSKDLFFLDCLYGKRLFSVRMVGMSTTLSLAATLLFSGIVLKRRNAATAVTSSRTEVLIALSLLLLALGPLLTDSFAGTLPTLLPAAFCLFLCVESFLRVDPTILWSRAFTASLALSLMSDIASTVLIRMNISWLSKEKSEDGISYSLFGLQLLLAAAC